MMNERMKKPALVAALSLLAAAAIADEGDAELGADLYDEYCSNCHGDDVDGLQNFSDDFAGFTARLEGETDDMPDFSDFFEPDEVSGLFTYLQTVVGGQGESP